jgi:histidine triad (HIT) family protein
MDNCIFCKIVKGEIPSYKVYEDENIIAFLDIFPQYKGHTLIVPKAHYETIFDLPDVLAAEVLPLGKRVINAIEKVCNADGYNFVQNNREHAGQAVMHYHMHIIPRYKSKGPDGFKGLTEKKEKYEPTPEEMTELAEKIKNNIG